MVSNDGNQASSTIPKKPIDLKQVAFYLVIGTIICFIYIVVAAMSFYFVIHQFSGKKINDALDGLYFAVVLMTSSGYKDLTPDSNIAILLAIFFAIVGVLCFGILVSLGADIFLASHTDLNTVFETLKNNPKVKYLSLTKIRWKVPVVLLAIHMSGGIVLLVFVGKMHFFRALYCVSSTITTVLSNDKCFSTEDRRIFALWWMLYAMITLNLMLYVFTEAWNERSKWVFAKKRIKRNYKLRRLEGRYFNPDGFMTRVEYIRYKLGELKRLRELGMADKEHEVKKPGPKDIDNEQASSIEDRIQRYLNIDDLWNVITIFVGYLGFSIVIFYAARYHVSGDHKTNSILDSVYFACVIMTSTGYGDLSPNKGPLALILASIFSLSGMVLFGLLLNIISQVLANRHKYRLSKLLSQQDKYRDVTIAIELTPISIKKNGKGVVVYFLLHMVFGTAILVLIEDLDFIRALYCISITITSAGTEKCFSTKTGRIFAIVWILLGAIYKNYVVFTFTEVYPEVKQRLELKRKAKLEDRLKVHKPNKPAELKFDIYESKPAELELDKRKPAQPKPAKLELDKQKPAQPKPAEMELDKQKPAEPKPAELELDKRKPEQQKAVSDDGVSKAIDINSGDDGGYDDLPEDLKELVKRESFSEEDIEAITKEFRKLDVARTGRLTLREVMLSKQ